MGINQMKDEITLLKEQATLLGIQFSNNIGLETLKSRIQEKLKVDSDEEDMVTDDTENSTNEKSERQKAIEEQTKLVRIRVTCMNPFKRDIPGGIFAVGNKYIGTVRKYVPYNTTEEGYHVPNCIYELLKRKQFTQRIKVKDRSVLGGERIETRTVSEFAIEVLPQLSEKELAKLAAEQKATGRI